MRLVLPKKTNKNNFIVKKNFENHTRCMNGSDVEFLLKKILSTTTTTTRMNILEQIKLTYVSSSKQTTTKS